MKKSIFILLAFSILFVANAALSSCSKDSGTVSKQESKIVGQWKCVYEDDKEEGYLLYWIFTFNEDGTGKYFEHDGYADDPDVFEKNLYYSYDEAKSDITIHYTEGGVIKDTETEHITWINDKLFTSNLIEDGSVYNKL